MTEIYIALDHVLLEADYSDPTPHAHLAKHLLISLEGNITYQIEGKRVSAPGILIDSNIIHTVESQHKKILVFLIEETSDIAYQMKEKYLGEAGYCCLEDGQAKRCCKIWSDYIDKAYNEEERVTKYNDVFDNILKICGLESSNRVPAIRNECIKKVIDIVGSESEITDQTIGKLADAVYLSQSRLSHLFKAETHIALNSFLVSARIWKTYDYMRQGKTITEAAIMAGFNSSSHFAATNKRLYGISAKALQMAVKVYEICK